jgi:hypothetical protein
VAVGAHQGVRVDQNGAILGPALPDHLRQVLQVHLVADPGARRHHAEVVEGVLAPAQEGIALAVAGELHFHVLLEGAGVAEGVDHDRMVDHQVDRRERIDALRVAAQACHGLAHGGEIDHRRHAGEVLHEHPRRAEGDLPRHTPLGRPLGRPIRQGGDVLGVHAGAVFAAQQVLEQDLQRKGQLPNAVEARLCEGGKAVIVVGAVADLEPSGNAVTVHGMRHANPQI